MYDRTIDSGEPSRTSYSADAFLVDGPAESWVALANSFIALTEGLRRATRAVGAATVEQKNLK